MYCLPVMARKFHMNSDVGCEASLFDWIWPFSMLLLSKTRKCSIELALPDSEEDSKGAAKKKES